MISKIQMFRLLKLIASEMWILLPILAVTVPFLNSSYFPTHDTLYKYQVFRFVYSEQIFNKIFPLWLPYGGFGLPSFLSVLSTISPTMYFVGFVGLILENQNTLGLFKASLFLEFFIFGIGLACISKIFLKQNLCRILLVSCCLFTTFPYSQPYFNLSIFYMSPLIMFFLLQGLHLSKPRFVMVAMCLFVLQIIGSAIYFVPLQLIPVLIVVIIYCVKNGLLGVINSATPRDLCSLTLLIIALTLAFATLYPLVTLNAWAEILPRENNSPLIPLHQYLSHGVHDFSYVLFSYFTGFSKFLSASEIPSLQNLGTDATIYVGILPIFLFLSGLIFSKRTSFYLITLIFVTLLSICLAGYFATIIYYTYVPIRLFRHIGLLFEFANKFLICAAFCHLDEILPRIQKSSEILSKIKNNSTNLVSPLLKNLVTIFFLLVCVDAGFHFDMGFAVDLRGANIWHDDLFWRVLALLVLTLLFILLLRRKRLSKSAIKLFVALFMIIDLGSYYKTNLDANSLLNESATERPASWTYAEPIEYQEIREMDLFNSEYKDDMHKLLRLHGANYFDGTLTFLGVDSCVPSHTNVSLISKDIYRSLNINRDLLRRGDSRYLEIENRAFLACGGNKIISEQPLDIKILDFNSNVLSLEIDADNKTSLIYSDAYHAKWKAIVGGSPVKIGNIFGFKSIQVPEGKHNVVFQFEDIFIELLFYFIALCAVCFVSSILFLYLLPPISASLISMR